MAKELTKEERILKILEDKKEGVTPKYIALLKGINHNTVKSILRKLYLEGKVKEKEGLRGYYILVEKHTHSMLFDWKFHNLVLTCSLSKEVKERISFCKEYSLSKARFEIGKDSGQATLHFSTDYPRSIQDLEDIYFLFCSFIEKQGYSVPDIDSVIVKSIEFNKDYEGVKLDGVKAITVSGLLTQFKLYNKKHSLREEYKIKVPIAFDSIINLLQAKGDYSSLDRDYTKISGTVHSIDKKLENHSRAIAAVLDKINNCGSLL